MILLLAWKYHILTDMKLLFCYSHGIVILIFTWDFYYVTHLELLFCYSYGIIILFHTWNNYFVTHMELFRFAFQYLKQGSSMYLR